MNIFFYHYSVDPDEMKHAAFHLVLHYLQKYSFRCFPEYKRLKHEPAISKQNMLIEFVYKSMMAVFETS